MKYVFGILLSFVFSFSIDAAHVKKNQKIVVHKLDCSKSYEFDFASLKNQNMISRYECQTHLGPKKLSMVFDAPEILIVPNAPKGTRFSLQLISKGTGTVIALLHGSFLPNSDGSVSAYQQSSNTKGTCVSFASTSVSGGIVGQNYVVLDNRMTSKNKIIVKFVCMP